MAPKPKRSALPRQPKQAPPKRPVWKTVALAAAFLGLAALASPVSQANLSPVYGSIPSSIFHQRGITIVALLAFMASKSSLRKFIPKNVRQYVPVQAYYVPMIQWALFKFSSQLGPEYGPLLTELLTFYPTLFLACLATSVTLEDLDLSAYSHTISEGVPPAVSYFAFSFAQKLFSATLPSFVGSNDFLTRSGLQLLVASSYAALSSTPYLLISIPAMVHTMFANPHYQSSFATKVLNQTLAAQNFILLERRDSNTGYISVLESHVSQYRVLRCDHSLLGGEWLVTPERKARGGQTGRETIYSVFTMLESVRLVEGASLKPDSEKNALFIGLGIGTSPTAFIKHGINTTIVELDPVVHEFAMKYFELPSNHTYAIEDAIGFVSTESVDHPQSYDYIIHDVFTGGAEPTALFTIEFLEGLEKMLKDDGVIAINYAGDMTLPPPQIILHTIKYVFPTCRVFRDTPESDTDPNALFVNLVVFCTKSPNVPLTFRKAVSADHLGSLSRREFIPPDPALEVIMPEVRDEKMRTKDYVLRSGNEGIIEKYHRQAAVRHWGIMRTVLPDAIWENW
ncbi:spermine/spermidine synthase family protein [Tothia fuscella]|uniref:Spermine/spermidine synthase family protein n=1 Tax=Tothia fuscella TaxID=1048955 RepID=A0A9P4TVL2_9PEZI|nr:spermine/spermidine synthase family protein [Tothia fuscella]